ncbi:protein AIM2 [Podospora fimiseda]|uniref:Protein AIM2 n=1 Tax=Podospora fimiseda TaxID=252190 RepID=A0AAN7BIM0_9PEZI|nr:protein AIM2 [Podospora fimiseda]
MQAPFCKDCFTGTRPEDVEIHGTEEKIHGFKTYVARPSNSSTSNPASPKNVIVYIPDAFGWATKHARILADSYATRVNCLVYLPDFMAGTPLSESFLETKDTSLSFFSKILKFLRLGPALLFFFLRNNRGASHPRILAFLRAIRPEFDKVGVAGFCWGGMHSILVTHDVDQNKLDGKFLVDCAFSAHPGMLSFPKDIEAVKQPLSVANGDDDEYMGRENMGTLIRILEAKGAEVGQEGNYEVIVYPGAKHGFAVRGDYSDPKQRQQRDASEDQAGVWFQKWFGSQQAC